MAEMRETSRHSHFKGQSAEGQIDRREFLRYATQSTLIPGSRCRTRASARSGSTTT